MDELIGGVFKVDASSEEEFQRKHDLLRDMANKLAVEQRARLDAMPGKPVWWADAVFLTRDIRSICNLLVIRDAEDVADVLAEIAGKSMQSLLLKAHDGDLEKALQDGREIMAEGDVLDAMLSQAASGQKNGW